MRSVGARIKECRLACKLTQEEVANHLGIGKQAVYKYESGAVTNIPLENIEKMAALFGVPPGYLSGWTEEDASAYNRALDEYLSRENSLFPISSDEELLINGYRSLPDDGKKYMLSQITAAKALFGEKDPAVSSSKSG